ncbi:hypothetical protein [Falsiroseomonas tokyonensis]|uniref:Uncharacterized protein n=1 Tax=Falsiroseomonas tokyonensis TaxID=430521 RepID=A0ABV7BZK7_9PROT|nr:hypothetical protein [Falsiroseomonas tokyonensis]MBU8540843.1 hypothetical protein [Falsiroseomonas tokyonensis]
MSAHPVSQPLRSPAQRAQIATIRQGIDADHPLSRVLEEIEAAAHDPLRWDGPTLAAVGELLTLGSGLVDEWFDGAGERAFGDRVDVAMIGRAA